MSHHISAAILKGAHHTEVARQYDLQGIPLGFVLTMFPIDHYYTACWAKQLNVPGVLPLPKSFDLLFPRERVVAELLKRITGDAEPLYAIVATDYFGGVGDQAAAVYRGVQLVDGAITRINDALRYCGVKATERLDEFDTVGLGNYRSMPEYLEKYVDMAEKLGV